MSGTPQTASTEVHAAGTIPLPHSLKQKIKDGIVALSLANLCFANAWFTILYDTDRGYYNKLPIQMSSTLALLINIIWLAATAPDALTGATVPVDGGLSL